MSVAREIVEESAEPSLLGLRGDDDHPADADLVATLRRAIQSTDDTVALPQSRGSADDLTAALRAVEAEALESYKRLGVPVDLAPASLADVGRKIDAYGASADLPWLIRVLRGDVLTFGRLQFERILDGGTRALHIPEGDSLHPADVDASLERARAHFGAGQLVCTSWLLDPTLEALPAGSNIIRFARRFEIGAVDPDEQADESAAKFAFRRPLAAVLDPTEVIPVTSVQRLIATHLRAGRHWSEPRGILREES